MKSVYVSAAAFALTAAVNLSPALALGPKVSGGNMWPGMSRHLTTPTSTAVAAPGHYEYQYGYDRHAAWRGHWVFVR